MERGIKHIPFDLAKHQALHILRLHSVCSESLRLYSIQHSREMNRLYSDRHSDWKYTYTSGDKGQGYVPTSRLLERHTS